VSGALARVPCAEGILTYDGVFVPRYGSQAVPTLYAIGVALSRIPRFAGHTRSAWTVLDHSLFVAALADGEPIAEDLLPLCALLHDAHEAMTSDVPTPFKDDELRQTQDMLDWHIAGRYIPGGVGTLRALRPIVKELDYRALLAEALVYGPPMLTEPSLVKHYFGAEPARADVELLYSMQLKPVLAHTEDRASSFERTASRLGAL